MTKSTQIHLEAIVPKELNGIRLDRALAQLFPQYSRSRLQEWIHQQQVSVNHKILKPKDKIYAQQTIIVHAELLPQEIWEAQAIALDVIFADKDIIVINKAAGLVVHPGAGNRDQTLVNALLHHYPELSQLPRAGIVHRLDKDTSGLLVIARTMTAHHALIKQLQSHEVEREYLAVVDGVLISGGIVDAPIGRHPTQRTRMAIIESGKPALTHYRINERFRAHTLLNLFLETGRTHQIRVHMAAIGHPLVGDSVYNRLKVPAGCSTELKEVLKHFKRQALHARRLSLLHPQSHLQMTWEAPIPEDLKILIKCLHRDQIDGS